MAVRTTRLESLRVTSSGGDSLGHRLNPRHNNINALRLSLAFVVLLSHSVQLATGGPDPVGRWTGTSVDLSTMAVDGFFALSGFLILGSYLNSKSTWRYLWRRVLRIMPGFWVCLVVSAFVIGPLTWMIAGEHVSRYPVGGGVSFLYNNSLLLIRQFDIAGTYGGMPVNGSLHTLFYEFLCYLGVALLGAVGLTRFGPKLTVTALCAGWVIVMAAAAVQPALIIGHPARELLLRYGSMFLAGMLLHILAGRVRLTTTRSVVGCVLILAALAASSFISGEHALIAYIVLAAPAVAFVVLSVGAGVRVAQIGSRRDLSYGLYVYAWPVQATLLLVGAGEWWTTVFVLVSLAISLGLAFLSWSWVESPALRLKSWTPRWRLPARRTS